MQKNTFWAVLLSMLFLIIWWTYFQPPAPKGPVQQQQAPRQSAEQLQPAQPPVAPQAVEIPGREVTVEGTGFTAVFTTKGAAVKHWYLKEKGGTVDLVLGQEPMLATFPGSEYAVSRPSPLKVVFTHVSPLGWRAVKTYDLSQDYLHALSIQVTKLRPNAVLPAVEFDWGPGLGTDAKEQKDNTGLTRAIGYTASKPRELKKFKKPGEYPAPDLAWVAVDNRYFLAAFVPDNPAAFATVASYQRDKKQPAGIALVGAAPKDAASEAYNLKLYLGPKGYSHLKKLNLGLEESVDFGFFGFLGKIALSVLNTFYKLTGNYGWAVILLTVLIQILVMPLTIKSFKASAAMKQLQPKMKELQTKFKNDPKRLNVEMLQLYKTNKVNPLGGCLPMLLQLPIFWALFTTLRNAYELRGASWILWVKDLSAPDTLLHVGGIPLNILPLIMGVGMFFQQKMMSISTDPSQKSLMYMMPVIFTFMFWGFPSGLVIYWLTNSILTMAEQYVILQRQQPEVA